MSFYSDFADHYDAIFPLNPTVYAFLRRYLPTPPAAILDVGCGTGHYTGKLAQDGYRAVGIDLDPAMIARARRDYASVPFQVLNMLDIAELALIFDGVLCIGNTAAHLTQRQFAVFLDQVRDVLTTGGIWILQVMNWDYVLAQDTVAFPAIKSEDGATFYREYREISEARVIFATRLEVDGRTVFDETTPLYPLRAAAIVALHTGRGFRLMTHVGSYGEAPFDPNAFSADLYVFERTEGLK